MDLLSQQSRLGWKGVQELAVKLTGKNSRLTLGECQKVIKEIKKIR